MSNKLRSLRAGFRHGCRFWDAMIVTLGFASLTLVFLVLIYGAIEAILG